MSHPAVASSAVVEYHGRAPPSSTRALLRELVWLSVPVMVEHVLHMGVGLADTYLANHLDSEPAAATAAVGTVSYFLWFIGLLVGAIATGSTALIARATGARHRGLANSVCGQSIASAAVLGAAMALLLYVLAGPFVTATRLAGAAGDFALSYLMLLTFSLPFTMVMFVAGACLRGAGDTLTPAIVMVVVDLVNIVASFALTYGWWGLPKMGFDGIAAGTVIAYVAGGVALLAVLLRGRAGLRLHWHRIPPHWLTLKRILRIGLPSGLEGLVAWSAQFAIVILINHLDPTNVMPAAHINAIRIEAISYMAGFAVAAAAATMVGQSLGMRDPGRAMRSALLAYAVGGGIMTALGIGFIVAGQYPSRWLSGTPQVGDLTAQCLGYAGFVQCGFAAAAIFGGALRGAGDTVWVMGLNLASIVGLRLVGVLIVGWWLNQGLVAIWLVLCAELMARGALMTGRFLHGGWKQVQV